MTSQFTSKVNRLFAWTDSVRPSILLFFATVIVAVAHIVFLTWVAHSSPSPVAKSYPAVTSDIQSHFAQLAVNLVDHRAFSLSTTAPLIPDALRTPGYPFFLAPFYVLFGSFYPVLFVQVLTLFLTVLLLFKIASRTLGKKLSLALCLLYLLLPDTGFSVANLMAENVATLIFMTALYLFLYMDVKNLYVRFAGVGALLGLMTLVRPASLYILIFLIPAYFLFYMPWKELSRKYVFATLVMISAFVAVLFPWCVRNHYTLNTWQFATTGAFVLFRQNAVQFYEAYNGVTHLEARYILLERAGLPHGSVPFGPEYSPVLKKVALEVIFEHPIRYALFHVTGFIPFFTGSGAHDYAWLVRFMQPNFNPPPEPSLVQALTPFSLPLLLEVLGNHGWYLLENAFWGIVILLIIFGLWRSKDVRQARFFFALMIYFAAVCGPIGHARYRIPIEPLLLLGAFSSALYLYESRKKPGTGDILKI
jgi:hypothetical protein